MAARDDAFGWLYISPLMLVLVPFFVAPILVVFAASFLQSDGFGGIIVKPDAAKLHRHFQSGLTFNLYYETVKFTVLTWLFSLIIGFWVAYFLVFHIRSPLLAIGLFLLCTVPFWTSNIIRMISWIPLLGKEGLINMALIKVGVVHEPLEFLLFSGFSVVVAYVHQLTIFMIVPIFNSMGRIDKRVVEAALDAGASRFDIMRYIILPLSKNGIALGTIFVVSIVMGDFFVIKVMSGGGSASVVGALYEDVGVLQYPIGRRQRRGADDPGHADRHRDPATVDVRKEITLMSAAPVSQGRRGARDRAARQRPALDLLRPAHGLYSLCARALRADDLHLHPVVPGCPRRSRVPDEGLFAALVRRPVHAGAHRRREGLVRPLGQARGHRHHHHRGRVVPRRACLPPPLPRRRRRVLSDDRQPGGAGAGAEHRHRPAPELRRHPGEPGTPRRSARSSPGPCRSACW